MKDIENYDDEKVRFADIIFLDIRGVGQYLSSPDAEGLGLIEGLRVRYGQKKWIIVYSSYRYSFEVYNNYKPDTFLGKSASVSEFEAKIIEGAKKIIDL